MDLTKCGECAHEVSTSAVACPNCGAPIQRRVPNARRVLFGISGVVPTIGLLGAGFAILISLLLRLGLKEKLVSDTPEDARAAAVANALPAIQELRAGINAAIVCALIGIVVCVFLLRRQQTLILSVILAVAGVAPLVFASNAWWGLGMTVAGVLGLFLRSRIETE